MLTFKIVPLSREGEEHFPTNYLGPTFEVVWIRVAQNSKNNTSLIESVFKILKCLFVMP